MHLLADLCLLLFFTGIFFSPVALGYLCINPALVQYNADSPAGQSVGFGCQDLTCAIIGGGTATFVMEAFTCNQFDSEWIETRNSAGYRNKQKGEQTLPTYETTLQVIGGASPKCPLGMSEVTLLDMGGRSIVWIVAKVSGTGSNDGSPTKIPVTLRYKIN